MTGRRFARWWTVVALVLSAVGCSTSETDGDRAVQTADSDAVYWSKCPDNPVWDRNPASITQSEAESPQAAVRAVAPDGTKIVSVSADAFTAYADVEVRLDDETGVFHVFRRPTGWIVRGGEGCATWAVGAAVMEPLLDCDSEARCGEQFVLE